MYTGFKRKVVLVTCVAVHVFNVLTYKCCPVCAHCLMHMMAAVWHYHLPFPFLPPFLPPPRAPNQNVPFYNSLHVQKGIMPFAKNSAGKWVASAEAGQSDAATRLVIVDKQVDKVGTFQRSFLKDVKSITFDSKVHTQAHLFSSIRAAHRAHGKPFVSIAFANHGPADAAAPWTIASDLAVPVASVPEAIDVLAPLVELLTSILEPTAIGQSHIIFMACGLGGFNPALIPALEELYHVDFMASSDTTGGAAAGANWKMETDDFNFAKVYCDAHKLEKHRGTMAGYGRRIGGYAGAAAFGGAVGSAGGPVGAAGGAMLGMAGYGIQHGCEYLGDQWSN